VSYEHDAVEWAEEPRELELVAHASAAADRFEPVVVDEAAERPSTCWSRNDRGRS
jgi:hypothetical protein